MEGKRLFIVEFTTSENKYKSTLFPSTDVIYVISDSYDKAVKKASMFLECREKNVIDEEGSLKQEITPKISGIKEVPEKVLW